MDVAQHRGRRSTAPARSPRRDRLPALVALLAAVTLVLAACGGTTGEETESSGGGGGGESDLPLVYGVFATPLTVVARAFAWFRVKAIPSSPCPALPAAVSVYCWLVVSVLPL